ncbi:hypothetical protein LTR37_000886 [Vermiconidia calcicola]|uniref:Uncharacterized protein n=1 Tax=Vermiconidia calcicola TaxID=1690605 RepID=A0ACC3NXH6_9PEZI|nr:hypothetical protein LTR37_000886 [Vermiconidia calcicola]
MKHPYIFTPLLLLPSIASATLSCTPSAFQAHLPDNARVGFTHEVPSNGTHEVPSGGTHEGPSNGTLEVPTSNIAYPTSPQGLPALCAVQINVTRSPESSFSFGLFLPQQNWNKRFLAVGNGGFAGGINYLDMAAGVGYGFATMSTDTGHNSTSGDLSWALEAEERRKDFGWRAMHESVVLAKQITQAYYGDADKVEYSYFSGCSTGGRQGLKEVQMFPEDFDGVLAGAPAWWTTHLQTWTIRVALHNLPVEAEWHIPVELFSVVEAEVLKQCDGEDGLVDGVITDPRRCDFFAEALLCGPDVVNQTTAGCLTAPQIGTLEKIYSDYVDVNQTAGKRVPVVRPPWSIEAEYIRLRIPAILPRPGPDWDFYDFNYSIVELADRTDPGNCNADDFDLRPFSARGGKLLTYHGASDALISTGSSSYFYRSVLKTLESRGIEVDPFYRHFLVPGMQHCFGTSEAMNAPWYFAGAGQAGTLSERPGSVHSTPDFEDREHDALIALMEWTEKGIAPDFLVATKWRNDTLVDEVWRQRKICPYPAWARFVGGGADPDVAGSWRCEGLYDMVAQHE